MNEKESELLKSLLAIFSVESEEHLQKISSSLLSLEKSSVPSEQEAFVEELFREVHSMKGSSRSVNKTEIESLCQSLESAFAVIKKKRVSLSVALFDILHKVVNHLEKAVHAEPNQGLESSRLLDSRMLVQALEQVLAANPVSVAPFEVESGTQDLSNDGESSLRTQVPSTKSVRITMDRVRSVLVQVDELRSVHLNALQRVKDLEELRQKMDDSAHTLESFHQLLTTAKHDCRVFQLLLSDLTYSLRSMLMVPFRPLLESLAKSVRDLARAESKDIDFRFEGADIEIDRRILDEMREPLLHVIRNCIDHGIEHQEERREKGKAAKAQIAVVVDMQTNGKVNIDISDDGKGVDFGKLRSAVIKSGSVSPKQIQNADPSSLLPFVFKSGVSTSDKITELSGRGLGLSIVQEKVMNAGGSVSIESTVDVGTTVKVKVPTTVMTLRGVLLDLEGRQFVLPTSHVEKFLRVDRSEIKTVENRTTIYFAKQTIALVSLASILNIDKAPGTPESRTFVAILEAGAYRLAIDVGRVLHEQEILLKRLGKQLAESLHISGVTLLGNGSIVPILNVRDLIATAVASGIGIVKSDNSTKTEVDSYVGKSVLIVEDSATTRALFKSVLEAQGFNVKTAVDGLDALRFLKTEVFDIVLSDVDMPRMNGFDLVAAVRANAKLSELPVVLISSMDTREYRERGIEVGANAYILKSHFDQEQLLVVLRRLIGD